MKSIKQAYKFIAVLVLLTVGLLTCSACNQTGSKNDSAAQINPTQQDPLNRNLPVPNNQQSTEFRVILYGNSHVGGLSNLLTELLKTGKPNAQVEVASYGGGFLVESYAKASARQRLEDGAWTHAIFQGQKYSQSQSVLYPTIATERWLDKAKDNGITPILFPEHAQNGRNSMSEGKYVYGIHEGIAAKQSTCLAPIPLVWERVLQLSPSSQLHSSDGNHAAYNGRFLTSLVFYEIITGQSADLLPYIASIDITEEAQSFFGQITSETIAQNPPCPT